MHACVRAYIYTFIQILELNWKNNIFFGLLFFGRSIIYYFMFSFDMYCVIFRCLSIPIDLLICYNGLMKTNLKKIIIFFMPMHYRSYNTYKFSYNAIQLSHRLMFAFSSTYDIQMDVNRTGSNANHKVLYYYGSNFLHKLMINKPRNFIKFYVAREVIYKIRIGLSSKIEGSCRRGNINNIQFFFLFNFYFRRPKNTT